MSDRHWSATSVLHKFGFRVSVLRTVALLLGVVCATAAMAQISPGPLSRAHRSLDGSTKCTSCHQVGGKGTLTCLECHTEIASRIANKRGLHARIVADNNGNRTCLPCHSEHNGQDFPLVRWQTSQQQFDHSQANYPLTGKHAGLSCNKCHAADKIAATEKSAIKIKDLNRTFLGLSRECSTCHNDPHQERLGRACEQCHDTTDWKKVAKFDHARTRYALTGGHTRVACEKCHTPAQPGGAPRWTGLNFDRCTACHTDAHRGAFSSPCQSCHTTGSWKSVPATTLATKFDHGKTKYPLEGKHVTLRCSQCHAQNDFKKPLTFTKCTDCHRLDPHGGQFAKRADRGECSACHSVNGFKQARFGLAEHKLTAYPLEARHATLGCDKCHTPAGKATRYRIKFAQCTDCHRDIHERQFAAAPTLNRCETCHTMQGFKPSTFTLATHQKTRFRLSGGHLAVACSDCHEPSDGVEHKKPTPYRFEDRSCTACHRDPHHGQFTERMRKTSGTHAGCETCHSLVSWKELSRFDHAATKFALSGAHRAVACADCHRPQNMETTLLNVNFATAPKTCVECHKDRHAGQFTATDKCEACHNTNKWKPSLFDHDKLAKFPLQGVHKNVRCARCHTTRREVNGTPVLFYKPTATECAACHGPNIKPLTQ